MDNYFEIFDFYVIKPPLHFVVPYLFISLAYLTWLIRRLTRTHRIDVVTAFSIFYHLIPIIIFTPFSYLELNSLPVGDDYYKILNDVPKAFFISSFSIVAFVLGTCILASSPRGLSFNPFFLSVASSALLTRGFSIFSLLVLSLMSFVLIAAGAKPLDARNFVFENPNYSQFLTLYLEIAAFSLMCCGAAWLKYRTKTQLFLLSMIFLLSTFAGTRYASVFIAFQIYSLYSFTTQRINFARLTAFSVTALIVGILLAVSRGNDTTLSIAAIFAELLYGNTFSDIRDFAWLLSFWDAELLWGRTYISGFSLFLPSDIFTFRSDWNWARFSSDVTGLDYTTHPGLRPGVAGELFFNFGLAGVFIASCFAGFICQQLNKASMKSGSKDQNVDRSAIAFIAALFVPYIFFTAGLIGLYIKAAIIFISLLVASVFAKIKFTK